MCAGKQWLSILTNSTDNFTIFAPTNDAIGKYKGTQDPEKMAAVLSYHIVPGYFANTTAFFNSPSMSCLLLLACEELALTVVCRQHDSEDVPQFDGLCSPPGQLFSGPRRVRQERRRLCQQCWQPSHSGSYL